MNDLLATVIEAHGGLDRWAQTPRLVARMSIGGPIWGGKGWPDALTDETVEVDTTRERTVFDPFLNPGQRLVFDGDSERLQIQDADAKTLAERDDARAAFKGHLRWTPWDRFHLGYFIGYAFWNYLTTPFVFTRPDVQTREIEPWEEAGQTWRRLHVVFPPTIATHNPQQVFYFDPDGLQRRMDYVTEVLGSSLVAHYTGEHREFDGLVFPTRRRVFRRNPDGTANVNVPSITIDISDVWPDGSTSTGPEGDS